MTLAEIATVLGIVAGSLVSLGVIWTKGIMPIARLLKKLNTIYDRVEELPTWCATVDESLKQLHPNGGRSLKDRVEQTHAMVYAHINDRSIHPGSEG